MGVIVRALVALLLVGVVAGCGDDDGGDVTPREDGGTPPGEDGGPRVDGGSVVGVDGGPDPAGCTEPTIPALDVEPIVEGRRFTAPVAVEQAPGSDDLWVVQQNGLVLIVRDGTVLETPFLDVRDRIQFGDPHHPERGLLGLAFHPDYDTNGRFFIYYTDEDNVVAEYGVSDDPAVADDTEVDRLVAIDDPEGNHNGGNLAFGPDGYLYAGTGDGGGGGDSHGEHGNGLNKNTLLGKLLRLDVDAPPDYAPADNPFTEPDGLPQIWSYGLRNPWRWSFDRMTGDLYIADVGQDDFEEVNALTLAESKGANFGWRAYEADRVFNMQAIEAGLVDNHTPPVVSIAQESEAALLRNACSVTGGYVYRGSAIPGLEGVYLFGDFCSNDVAAFRWCEGEIQGEPQRVGDLRGKGGGLASFGQDNDGELYLIYVGSGDVLRIIPG